MKNGVYFIEILLFFVFSNKEYSFIIGKSVICKFPSSLSPSPPPSALCRGLNGHANTATIAGVSDAAERREFKSIYPLEMCQYCLLRRDFMEILNNRK